MPDNTTTPNGSRRRELTKAQQEALTIARRRYRAWRAAADAEQDAAKGRNRATSDAIEAGVPKTYLASAFGVSRARVDHYAKAVVVADVDVPGD